MREASGEAAGLAGLPSGGGGVAPLGERFQPDLVRGTGNYTVPINCPKGPNEQRPSVDLTYSTGAGNGPFGMGWRFGALRIERRTDRGVPSYTDDDTFVLGDAEVLVPVGGNRYRPKTDTHFWLIERTDDSWRIRVGDGRMLLLGRTDASRETTPGGVFAWHLDEERDAAGNTITYSYLRDGGRLYPERITWSIFSLGLRYEARPDVIRNARSGFERLTALRGTAIELHCSRLAPTLTRTYELGYQEAANGASLLTRIGLSATLDGETAAFPTLEFDYSSLDLGAWEVARISAAIAPPAIGDDGLQLVDVTGDGVPDLVSSAAGRMYVWRNGGRGVVEGPTAVAGLPSSVSLARDNVALADLTGNGRVDLFAVDQPLSVAFENDGRGGFAPEPIVFRGRPAMGLADPDTRLMDVDGDGVVDLIQTGRSHFLLYHHETGEGWSGPDAVRRVADLDTFPDVSLEDRSVRLADMTGDGLQDFVLLQSGNIAYWPYLGNGRWGARVEMTGSPVLPRGYREDRLHVVDLDGDGCADLLYVDHDRILLWLNRSGAGYGPPAEVPVAPPGGRPVLPSDFYGDGRPGLAWSAAAAGPDDAGYRFLRLDGDRKPYLLTTIDNGLGGRFEMTYTTSTAMRLLDEAEGRPWQRSLPFAVHTVERIREVDGVDGRVTELVLRYHDGVYDGYEREFRGFSGVTLDLAGDGSIPDQRQEIDLYQGDPEEIDLVARARQRALSGAVVETKTFERMGGTYRLREFSTQTWDVREEVVVPAGVVHFPFVASIETSEVSAIGAPSRIERSRFLDYDAYGNPARRLRESLAAGAPETEWIRTEERFTFTSDESRWLVRLPVRHELHDSAGSLCGATVSHYDGPEFVGLPEGQVTAGLVTRTQELRLLDAKLPAGYLDGRDPTALGYEWRGVGGDRGLWGTTAALRRDGKGNVVAQRDGLGHETGIRYDSDGVFPERTTDPRGRETDLVFDPRSCEPSTIDLPDGRRIRYVHDAIGRLIGQFETDDAGQEQLVKAWNIDISSVPSSVTSFAPRSGGRGLDEMFDAADPGALDGVSVARSYYDGFGKELHRVATAPDGPAGTRRFAVEKRKVLNPKGMVASTLPEAFVPDLVFVALDPVAVPSSRQRYDVSGNVIETAGPGPIHAAVLRDTFTVSHFEGEAAGPFGAPPTGPASKVEHYDARDRLVGVDEEVAGGVLVTTRYDLTIDGKIGRIRDGAGAEVAKYTYAGPGEAIEISHRDVGARRYYRDATDRVAERVDQDGSRLLFSYDPIGRLTRVEHRPAGSPAGVAVREIFYDEDPSAQSAGRFLEGRVALVREQGSEFRFSYDRAGRQVRDEVTVAGTTLVTRSRFDLQGTLRELTYPDGHAVAFDIDDSGSITSIPGIVGAVDYDAQGVVTAYALANGVDVSRRRHPSSGRLVELAARRSGTPLRRIEYAYDAVGNITGLIDAGPHGLELSRFRYDGLHRLTGFQVRTGSAAGPVARAGAYAYSDTGDLLRFDEGAPLALTYGDAARPGRLTSVATAGGGGSGPRPLAYDARGNVEAFGDLAGIEYDPFDRVARLVKTDGTEVRFAYDVQNRRVLKEVTDGGATTRTVYATGLYERSGNTGIRHSYLGSHLVASTTVPAAGAPSIAFYLSDHHGTILLATNGTGGVVESQRYQPFGGRVDQTVALDRYLGRSGDRETGLLHLGARYYLPTLGRFVSPDWFVLESPDKAVSIPQSLNLYSYAVNNPLVFKDPSGMWFFVGLLIALAVGFVVGFVTGLIVGLANGKGWGSLLVALETGLVTAFGAAIGFSVGALFGLGWAVFFGLMAGLNGLISGSNQIYEWRSGKGWFAFLSDSSWGLIGTTLGNVVHVVNLFWSGSSYRGDLSRRQNRHVYEGGVRLKSDFAFTMGNVISNAGQGGKGINASFIANHEELHVWQSRIFGPLYQATYVVWGVGGWLVATVYWFFNTEKDYGKLVETAAYYDNPFEYWAYNNDSNWPPSGVDSSLAWG